MIVGSVDRIQPRDNSMVSIFDAMRARTLDFDQLLGGFFVGGDIHFTFTRFLERIQMEHIETKHSSVSKL